MATSRRRLPRSWVSEAIPPRNLSDLAKFIGISHFIEGHNLWRRNALFWIKEFFRGAYSRRWQPSDIAALILSVVVAIYI